MGCVEVPLQQLGCSGSWIAAGSQGRGKLQLYPAAPQNPTLARAPQPYQGHPNNGKGTPALAMAPLTH